MKLQLIPREEKFYDFLEVLTAAGNDAIRALRQLFQDLEAGRDPSEASRSIQQARLRAKATRDEITMALCHTFITPLDREDIQALSMALYRIPKILEKVQERALLYQLQPKNGDMTRQLDIIEKATLVLTDMINAMRSAKNAPMVEAKNRIVDEAENQADIQLTELLRELYREPTDCFDAIKRKDIYDMMEKVIDRQRDASHIILEIFLKHS